MREAPHYRCLLTTRRAPHYMRGASRHVRRFTICETSQKICAGKIEISLALTQISAQNAHKNDNPELVPGVRKILEIPSNF